MPAGYVKISRFSQSQYKFHKTTLYSDIGTESQWCRTYVIYSGTTWWLYEKLHHFLSCVQKQRHCADISINKHYTCPTTNKPGESVCVLIQSDYCKCRHLLVFIFFENDELHLVIYRRVILLGQKGCISRSTANKWHFPNVVFMLNAGPTLKQHWVNGSCLLVWFLI